MSVRTILTPITGRPRARSTLETALLVARRFGSHVVGLHARPSFKEDNVEAIMELASLARSSPLLREVLHSPGRLEDETTQAARRLFDNTCRAMEVRLADGPGHSPGVSAAFKVMVGDAPEAIAEKARVFDLVVAGQPKTDPDHSLRETLRSVLFHSRS